MDEHKPGTVFAYVAFKSCGCVATATTPAALSDSMKSKFFRSEMLAGRVRTVMSREEWLTVQWRCTEHNTKVATP